VAGEGRYVCLGGMWAGGEAGKRRRGGESPECISGEGGVVVGLQCVVRVW